MMTYIRLDILFSMSRCCQAAQWYCISPPIIWCGWSFSPSIFSYPQSILPIQQSHHKPTYRFSWTVVLTIKKFQFSISFHSPPKFRINQWHSHSQNIRRIHSMVKTRGLDLRIPNLQPGIHRIFLFCLRTGFLAFGSNRGSSFACFYKTLL